MFKVTEATGCSFSKNYLLKEDSKFYITDFGAASNKSPVENTEAINSAISKAAVNGGGTVVIPKGDFRVYTINLMSNVNIYMSNGSVLHAAKTDIKNSYELQVGEGGNFKEPEVNVYVGLQDHGHTYLSNSLIYGSNISNVMIYGNGLIDGSFLNDKGQSENVLMGGDPHDPIKRTENGHNGEWFGNKAIALVGCENVALCDFSIVAGGHFAVICTCVKNLLVKDILIDTNRDALDIDCCQNVTITNSTFNSLTDDAIVMKASYGGGIFMPVKNVLIEDCMVCGYDMGSVYSKKYTMDKLIATDRCGPTARVKLGTESTCGYDSVTVRRIKFKRSRGFALEAVDGADLSNIIFEDSTLEDISSSPIFIKVGDRSRFPVTGNSEEELIIHTNKNEKNNVRLDNLNWVLPNKKEYQLYPAKRYMPSYNRNKRVSVDGNSYFQILDSKKTCKINSANYNRENGKIFAVKYDDLLKKYVSNYEKELKEEELPLYANAIGSDHVAYVHDIIIRNISVKNVDPRYPIEIMGLEDSHIKNIFIQNVNIEYRGGLSLREAVEQRQLNTNWEYNQNGKSKTSIQSLPWLVNTFFLKNEGLLPRVQWNSILDKWDDSPFNVPELPDVYPEPSNWGILPAYGLYARHVENLYLNNIQMNYIIDDERYPIILDDVVNGELKNIKVSHLSQVEEVVCVKNNFKRPTGLEYIKDYPYHATSVGNMHIEEGILVKHVEVNAPAPGTPKDSLYRYETVAIPENGYTFSCNTSDYHLPETVFRPFFIQVPKQIIRFGETISFEIIARQPAYEVSDKETDGKIYNESISEKDFSVGGIKNHMILRIEKLPKNAEFDILDFVPGKPCKFTWTPDLEDICNNQHTLKFIADDGIIPISMEVNIEFIK